MRASRPASHAAMLAALAQPTRLKIVEAIASGDREGTPAGVIARQVDCPPSTLSFHLKELAEAGLLEAKPRGRFILYAVVPGAFHELAEFVARLPGAAAAKPPATKSRGRAPKRSTEETPAGTDAGAQLSIF